MGNNAARPSIPPVWAAAASGAFDVILTANIGQNVLRNVAGSIAADVGDPLFVAGVLQWNATHVPLTDACLAAGALARRVVTSSVGSILDDGLLCSSTLPRQPIPAVAQGPPLAIRVVRTSCAEALVDRTIDQNLANRRECGPQDRDQR